MKNKLSKTLSIVIVLILVVAAHGHAQVQGSVMDTKRQGIVNAIIIATDSTSNAMDTVRSDKRGFYIFKKLQPGKYRIEAMAAGFQNAIFENVIANEKDPDEGTHGDDISSATRLEIILKPVNASK